MAAEPGHNMIPQAYGHLRASHADRERALDVLKAAFAEGRLYKNEFDERAAQVHLARTYAELAALTGDLPAGPLGTLALQAGGLSASLPPRTSSRLVTAPIAVLLVAAAVGLLSNGVVFFLFPLATIAILLTLRTSR